MYRIVLSCPNTTHTHKQHYIALFTCTHKSYYNLISAHTVLKLSCTLYWLNPSSRRVSLLLRIISALFIATTLFRKRKHKRNDRFITDNQQLLSPLLLLHNQSQSYLKDQSREERSFDSNNCESAARIAIYWYWYIRKTNPKWRPKLRRPRRPFYSSKPINFRRFERKKGWQWEKLWQRWVFRKKERLQRDC